MDKEKLEKFRNDYVLPALETTKKVSEATWQFIKDAAQQMSEKIEDARKKSKEKDKDTEGTSQTKSSSNKDEPPSTPGL